MCYINAALHSLAAIPELQRRAQKCMHQKVCKRRRNCPACEFETFMQNQQSAEYGKAQWFLENAEVLDKDFKWGTQQDAAAYLRALIGVLCENCDYMRALFATRKLTQLQCRGCHALGKVTTGDNAVMDTMMMMTLCIITKHSWL